MFSSLLRPSRSQRRHPRVDRPASPSADRRSFSLLRQSFRRTRQHSYQSYDEDDITEEEDGEEGDEDAVLEEEDEEQEDDEEDENAPLLPIFSAAHLDQIPVYALTHAIRELVVARCETTLSWEQLRSPQVSAFLLKPIQQTILSEHFTAATEYGLLTNCLQFNKEATMNPGNSGTSRTRAMLCELLAIRLLKEYSTRTLIDALSYDFDPLRGHSDQERDVAKSTVPAAPGAPRKQAARAARISCFEVALRAQAKRFLAHPLVVQQLEAIWAGTIVFYSAADSMHRKQPAINRQGGYGTTNANQPPNYDTPLRRTVTIYNPQDASLFKLSRLRVPRYRNILSTLSFAVLLGLYLAVLSERSLEITALEVAFWIWSAGYMLDEIVGFTDQGFSLYIASFWNTFDLGILLILFAHLCLRIYGIVSPVARKHATADLAYDILAADAILLFPRLFSVLDHYRYFSQLLIAFRMMAQDLVAVLVLIVISCSGFFVALTLAFPNEGFQSPSSVAYALLQILMGFTPAAWDRWPGYNLLGKFILTLFLFICHFLVVVILMTVLTNSFMAIVQNANEEHQFVFAVNTISSVKSDALFSYVAPTNVFQWAVAPLRYFVPFRQYIKVNRTIIKITHFPILFTICLYERTVLRASGHHQLDLVESRDAHSRPYAPRLPRLARAPSIATFKQDRALDEVFRNAPDGTIQRPPRGSKQRQSSAAVNKWMNTMADDLASPPLEDDQKVVESLERKRYSGRWMQSLGRERRVSRRTMSIASDPEDLRSRTDFLSPSRPVISLQVTPSQLDAPAQQTDADGDDEMQTDNDEIERTTVDQASEAARQSSTVGKARLPAWPMDYFSDQTLPFVKEAPLSGVPIVDSGRGGETRSDMDSPSRPTQKRHARVHSRNLSSTTQLYRPVDSPTPHSDHGRPAETPQIASQPSSKGQSTAVQSGAVTPVDKHHPNSAGTKTPKKPAPGHRVRPILPNQSHAAFRSAPNVSALIGMSQGGRRERRRPFEMDLVSDIGDNKAIGGGYVGAIPAGFASQVFQASAAHRHSQQQTDEQERLARLMMSRMNSLEENMREIIHEMREAVKYESGRSRDRSPERSLKPVHREKRSKAKNALPSDHPLQQQSDDPDSATGGGTASARMDGPSELPKLDA